MWEGNRQQHSGSRTPVLNDRADLLLSPGARAYVANAPIHANDQVLDVTQDLGTVASLAAARIGPLGSVVQLDGDLSTTIANPHRSYVGDHEYDVVLGANVFATERDVVSTIRNLRRFVKVGGFLALSLWDRLSANPYAASLANAVGAVLGPEAAATVLAPFVFSKRSDVRPALLAAGFDHLDIRTLAVPVHLPPLAECVPMHLAATPISDLYAMTSPAAREEILVRTVASLGRAHRTSGFTTTFSIHVAAGRRSVVVSPTASEAVVSITAISN